MRYFVGNLGADRGIELLEPWGMRPVLAGQGRGGGHVPGLREHDLYWGLFCLLVKRIVL